MDYVGFDHQALRVFTYIHHYSLGFNQVIWKKIYSSQIGSRPQVNMKIYIYIYMSCHHLDQHLELKSMKCR